ncbi:hypothetical protein PO124_32120 [Bacillus licheniformis]|nr:hypothetical protein [Bacillus licheniformis]
MAKVPQTTDEKSGRSITHLFKSLQDQGAIVPVSYIKRRRYIKEYHRLYVPC